MGEGTFVLGTSIRLCVRYIIVRIILTLPLEHRQVNLFGHSGLIFGMQLVQELLEEGSHIGGGRTDMNYSLNVNSIKKGLYRGLYRG